METLMCSIKPTSGLLMEPVLVLCRADELPLSKQGGTKTI